MNKNTHFSGHPVIKQLLNLIPKDLVSRTAGRFDSDGYYKTCKTNQHLVSMLYATLSGVSSLRELSTVMLACEGKLSHLNLDSFPKRSTLSDANANRSSEVFAATHDHTFLKDLDLKKGSFVVFDKAYSDYRQYFEWTGQDIYFFTRQKTMLFIRA